VGPSETFTAEVGEDSNGKVKRDGRTYKFDTELIGAGGYNIQEYHYRYIIKTDLPDSKENSAVENIKAKMGVLKKIRTILLFLFIHFRSLHC
jgi:hypothetical protein